MLASITIALIIIMIITIVVISVSRGTVTRFFLYMIEKSAILLHTQNLYLSVITSLLLKKSSPPERMGERRIPMQERSTARLPPDHMHPDWGTSPQPRHVP